MRIAFAPMLSPNGRLMGDLTVSRLGPERSRWIYPIRTLAEAGGTIAFGSDWPVTTMDPLQAIEVAVTRIDPEAPADSTRAFLPDERLDVTEAIKAARKAKG